MDENRQKSGIFSRLNSISAAIVNPDESTYDPIFELSTYSHYPQRERKKVAKEERENTAAISSPYFFKKLV
jgi:hypothetical protein